MNLKDILDQSKQSIDVNKYKHPTGTISTTLLNNKGGSNPYVQLDRSHKNYYITSEDNYRYQLMMIL